MSAPLVFAVGQSLFWSQNGRLYRADRMCRGSGFTPWKLTDEAPGMGGDVLTAAEVARLVAPHEPSPLCRNDYEREQEQRARRDDAALERRRMGDDL